MAGLSTGSARPPARSAIAALGLLFVVINLPLVHGLLTADRSVAGGVLVVTVFADLAVLGAAALMVWGTRNARHRGVTVVALGDVVRSRSGFGVERADGGAVTISGEIVELAADRIVIDVGVEHVAVDLDGYACRVGYQQRAQVRCRLSESTT